jgi:predicted dehydrogenase
VSGRDGRLRFGVLGTGSIAAEVTDALHLTRDCAAQAVASRDAARATAFAAAHGVARAHDGYDELITDPDVDIVYIATPHTQHSEWAIRAAQAGKHVLCEKPMTISARTTEEVVDAARRSGVFLVEAFAYHFHPQTHRLLELIRGGVIGDVGAVDVTFSHRLPDPAQAPRVLQADLGGGGILDVGCYCTSMSRRIVMAATGREAVEPDEVVALAVLDPVERTDRWAMAIMRFESDVLAQLSCGVSLTQDDHIRVYGSKGQLHIDQPCWLGGRRDAASRIEARLEDGETRRVDIAGGRNIFALEADGVAAMLRRGAEACHASWDESIANMRTLDRWRAAAGVRYPGEDDG